VLGARASGSAASLEVRNVAGSCRPFFDSAAPRSGCRATGIGRASPATSVPAPAMGRACICKSTAPVYSPSVFWQVLLYRFCGERGHRKYSGGFHPLPEGRGLPAAKVKKWCVEQSKRCMKTRARNSCGQKLLLGTISYGYNRSETSSPVT